MKLALNLFFLSITFFIFDDKSFSLSDYQIKKICKNEIRPSRCINNLREKKSNLKKGKKVEIPVIPYKSY